MRSSSPITRGGHWAAAVRSFPVRGALLEAGLFKPGLSASLSSCVSLRNASLPCLLPVFLFFTRPASSSSLHNHAYFLEQEHTGYSPGL